MKKQKLQVGDVVQIAPEHDPIFGGCFMQVTEPKPWGVQGFVKIVQTGNMFAFYRCKFENMELVGRAVWLGGGEEPILDDGI